MQGESKTSWFRKINKTWRVCPHFHSARLANTTWPTQSLVDGDTVILTYQPSPVHWANAATLHATWHAPVKILFTASQCGYPRLKFLDYHHMIWKGIMRDEFLRNVLRAALKKKMLDRNGEGSAKPYVSGSPWFILSKRSIFPPFLRYFPVLRRVSQFCQIIRFQLNSKP